MTNSDPKHSATPTTNSDLANPSLDKKHELDAQTEQARRMLMRLQWLMIILLGSGLVWLYMSFESVVSRVGDKLTKVDAVDGRLNSIDDRLFALTPTDTRQQVMADESVKDKEFIGVQLALVEQLYEQGRYGDALTALDAISYQLRHAKGLAAPVKSTLSQKLKADSDHIRALRHQPNAWQAQIIQMRDVQAFLRQQMHPEGNTPLSRSDIVLHDANMLLSLAISSANVRDAEQLITYLKDAKAQLQTYDQLQANKPSSDKPAQARPSEGKSSHSPSGSSAKDSKPTTPDEAIGAIEALIANPPKDRALQSPQVLKQP